MAFPHTAVSRLLIKFPTRSRPDKFKRVLQRHIDLLSERHEVRFVISMDEDDDTMNRTGIRRWLDSLNVDLKYRYGGSTSKIEACNADMRGEHADVYLLTSDDMIPCVEDYDDTVFKHFEAHFPNFDGAIRFHDGFRAIDDPLMTLPVIGGRLFKALRHFYPPGYLSVYADNDTTEICRRLGRFAMADACIIRHEWVPGHHPDSDELHRLQESPEVHAIDRAFFERRRQANFNLDEVAERLAKTTTARSPKKLRARRSS